MSGPLNTNVALRNWEYGAGTAERLAASVLRLEGYEDVEPQAPQGGPDGRKDLICTRDGRKWLGAVYFPSTDKSFEEVRDKFESDLAGVAENACHGIAFLTNQRLTVGNRDELREIAQGTRAGCQIYDRERLRVTLDSPSGYGIRIAFLRIPMTLEEQLSYFAMSEERLYQALSENSRRLESLASAVIHSGQIAEVTQRTVMALADDSGLILPESSSTLTAEDVRGTVLPGHAPVTSALTVEMIRMIHRLVGPRDPLSMPGNLRESEVWIQQGSASGGEVLHTPPSPDEILGALTELCEWWRSIAQGTPRETDGLAISHLAEFHGRFLSIHPFTDANGRVARALLMQQSLDLVGAIDLSRLNRGAEYMVALSAANRGNFAPLENLLRVAVSYAG